MKEQDKKTIFLVIFLVILGFLVIVISQNIKDKKYQTNTPESTTIEQHTSTTEEETSKPLNKPEKPKEPEKTESTVPTETTEENTTEAEQKPVIYTLTDDLLYKSHRLDGGTLTLGKDSFSYENENAKILGSTSLKYTGKDVYKKTKLTKFGLKKYNIPRNCNFDNVLYFELTSSELEKKNEQTKIYYNEMIFDKEMYTVHLLVYFDEKSNQIYVYDLNKTLQTISKTK